MTSRAQQDQVNWSYATPPYYHPRNYLNPPPPPYATGRICNGACCRRPSRAGPPVPPPPTYATHPPPHHYGASLPCRPQENPYSRPPPLPPNQVSSFVPVNPFLAPHRPYPQHQQPQQPQLGVHRPIPQSRFDYNDYHHQYSKPSTSGASVNHQAFHPVIKPNSNAYGVNNQSHVSSATLDQYTPSTCSLYSSQGDQEPALPNLDLRKFLSTWQDKDEDVFESDQLPKPKPQYQEPPQNQEVFKPLDCSKRTDTAYPMYGYSHSQMNNHPNHYNKPLQAVPSQQGGGEPAFPNPSYMPGPTYGSLAPDNECGGFNPSQVSMPSHGIVDTDPQHVGFERRIEKIYNPHSCKPMSNLAPGDTANHYASDDVNKNLQMKPPPPPPPNMAEKNQYHLSASLECEDLFDDINRRKEERQRNIVHPLVYQESFHQRPTGHPGRPKMDIPHVSVKPNTAAQVQMNYPVENFSPQDFSPDGDDARKIKGLPFKKWVQKHKKSHDELFNRFMMDFTSRETVIERLHVPSCEQPMPPVVMDVDENVDAGMVPPENMNPVPSQVSGAGSGRENVNFEETISTSADHNYDYASTVDLAGDSMTGACAYRSVAELVATEHPLEKPPSAAGSANEENSSSKPGIEISPVDIDLNIASSCDLNNIMDGNPCKEQSSQRSYLKMKDPRDANECTVNGADLISIVDDCSSTVPMDGEAVMRHDDGCNDVLAVGDQVNEIFIHSETREVDDSAPTSTDGKEETIIVTYTCDDDEAIPGHCSGSLISDCNIRVSPNKTLTKPGLNKFSLFVRRRRRVSSRETWRIKNRLPLKSVYHSRSSSLGRKKSKRKKNIGERLKILVHASERSFKMEDANNREGENIHFDSIIGVNFDDTKDVNPKDTTIDLIYETDSKVKNNPPMDLTVDKIVSVESTVIDRNSNVVSCKSVGSTDVVVTSADEDFTHQDPSVGTTDQIGEGLKSDDSHSLVDVVDGVLDGILNWPHHEEEISSTNLKESLRVSLPWGKIFKDETVIPEEGKTLSIGPARIEFRYTPSDDGQPGNSQANGKPAEKMSCVFPVKQVLVKRNSSSSNERLPKMVIKKTGGEEYKSYIKDANLRVVSIKNPGKDGQAEVIIESDRPLTEAVAEAEAEGEMDGKPCLIKLNVNEDDQSSDVGTSTTIGEPNGRASELRGCHDRVDRSSSEQIRELFHCLLCQESLPSIEEMRSHENSLSHRHIDIIQRGVLHRLQQSNQVPKFQPLTTTEIEYLNWKPAFSGYINHYFNKPL
ncbi:Hypothetical protein NTJ_02775 [Nesidiocoris tenuis]|uniref:C2H2-type domain-containing protein n=1 Tax=Nesidiocoris tenuis TaxID=355587 RepID=A0ABN7ACF6_9HEMI|nr:Hypothetical protein NTJ_02775 [Nesidiocoris tenuis]